jgi:hypothetical protein
MAIRRKSAAFGWKYGTEWWMSTHLEIDVFRCAQPVLSVGIFKCPILKIDGHYRTITRDPKGIFTPSA